MLTRPGRRSRGQGGVTLVEVLLALSILGLVGAPLGMVLTTVFRSSVETGERVEQSNQAQRIGEAWTHDVQSVDSAGVNEPVGEGYRCANPAVDPSDELHRVTFNWDVDALPGQSTVSRTATWVLKGTGTNVSLVRRYCEDLVLKDESVLAEGLDATSVASRETLVRGPGTSPATAGDFCPAGGDGVKRTCTIQVNGSFTYSLTVTRRIPDVRGATITQYSPPPPTNLSHDNRYQFVNVYWDPPALAAGQSPITQYRLTVHRDSPAGAVVTTLDVAATGGRQMQEVDSLDLDTSYWVVMRSFSTYWGDETAPYGPMVPTATSPEAPTITGATAGTANDVAVTWTHGGDGGSPFSSWSIWAFVEGTDPANPANLVGPFRPSPDGPATTGTATGLAPFVRYRFIVADHNAVGEGLRSAPSSAVMTRGSNTVFVKSPGGVDNGTCGSTTSPCLSIGHGISRLPAGPNAVVAVAGGATYPRFTVTAGVTVRGGFPSDFSSSTSSSITTIGDATYANQPGATSAVDFYGGGAAPTLANLTIQRSAAAGATYGIDVDGATGGLNLENVTVQGGSGLAPTGIRLRNGSVATITGSTISSGTTTTAGSSAYGIRALTGSSVTISGSTVTASAGAAGAAGANGATGSGGCAGLAGVSQSSSTVGSCGQGAGTGGGGGSPGSLFGSGGAGAAGGNVTGGPTGGAGGGGGYCITPSPGAGGNGGGGAGGGAGAAGTGAVDSVANAGDAWAGTTGAGGGTGTIGKSGAGGGGGGGTYCAGGARGAAGGSGGGAAQGGGTGGASGGAGGGSFAVYANNASITVAGSTLTAGAGGAGGTGGTGGAGGGGGSGGNRATQSKGGNSGHGGGGGGAGGGGGGGGAQGGPSMAAARFGTTGAVTISSSTVTAAAAGAGGAGGAGGTGGAGGASGGSGGSAGAAGTTGAGGAAGIACTLWVGTACTP